MIVDSAGGENSGGLDARLVPGPYVVRRWEENREIGSMNVTVALGDKTVACP